MIVCLQVSSNRSGPAFSRAVISNQYPSHSNIGSPSLSTKGSNLDYSPASFKSSPVHQPYPSNSAYASPTVSHRVPANTLGNSIHDSPSLSVRSSTNTSFYNDSNQPPLVINTDSASLKSDDSSTFSEGHLHPSQQGATIANSVRNQEVSPNAKNRLGQATVSISSAGNTFSFPSREIINDFAISRYYLQYQWFTS